MEVIFVNIVFTRSMSEQIQNHLNDKFPQVHFIFYEDELDIEKHIQNAEVLVTYGGDLTDKMIEQATNLKWIMVLSAGVDKLPLASIKQRNILVTNARGIHKVPMAEYAISMLLQVYRNEKTYIEQEQQVMWDQTPPIKQLSGQSVLIAGTGAIGAEFARLAKAFRMKTYGISRSGKQVEHFDQCYQVAEIDQLLPKVDIIVSVLPSTDETRGLFTFERFQSMQDHVVFLNMGRGDVAKNDDILRAVKTGEIKHAILDVFETEPLPENHPFWIEENVTVTPHISGIFPNYDELAIEIFTYNLSLFLNHQKNLKNIVNITDGY